MVEDDRKFEKGTILFLAPSGHTRDVLAAYGVIFAGLEDVYQRLDEAPDWPTWRVRQERGEDDFDHGAVLVDGGARIGFASGGGVVLHRAARELVFRTPEPFSRDALLHPGLVPVAAVIALWDGRAALHCSALLVDGALWAFLADREGGKSTTAALCVQRGCELFTDDMLIADGTLGYAGPPSIDLRAAAADAIGADVTAVDGRDARWRLRVPSSQLTAPIAGLVTLDWSDSIVFEELGTVERMSQLERHLSMPTEGRQLLALAQLPMLRFSRPQDLMTSGRSVDALLEALRAFQTARATACG